MNQNKILVVDDDEGILEALNIMLDAAGYEVELSEDGEALGKIGASNVPDLILLDVLLSGKDGRDLCRVLKANDDTKNIPVIMISAHPGAEESVKQCGADGFVAKPFEVEDLLNRIHGLISN